MAAADQAEKGESPPRTDWHVDVCVALTRDSALGRASKAFSDAEEELTNALTGAEKKALLNLLNAHSEIVGAEVFENFCMGFRLGALAILDILAGADQLFPEG